MREVLSEALGYLQTASRHKWLSILIIWVLCLSGWTFVSRMPDEFAATARVHVDTRSVLRPLLKGLAIHPDINGQVRLMTKVMFSRPNLEKIARMTDLDLNAKDDADMDNIVTRLRKSMSISSAKRTNLFTIASTDSDPKVAKRMVQSLLTIFVEDTLGASRKDSDSAQRFLDQQIKEYEMRLLEAEASREEFKRKHLGLLPGQGDNLYQQLKGLSNRLEEANLTLQESIYRRDEMKRQLEDEEPMFEDFGMAAETTDPTELRIQELQNRIDEMLLSYTEAHPTVLVLKNAIAELEKKALEDEGELDDGLDSEDDMMFGEANPVFQQLKIVLSDAEANVASLGGRVKNFEEKIEMLKQQLDARLKVETQLKSLNRDYTAVQQKYDTLVQRRETARLSESLEQNTETVKFRIVDPARVPLKPSGPNRILFSSLIFVFAILIGLAVALVLALIRPTFISSQKIREVLGLPVLGTVSMHWIDAVKRDKWRGFLRFSAVSVLLLLVFSAVIVLEVKGLNLASI